MTIGGKGIGTGSKKGDRTPAVFIHNTKGLLLISTLGTKISYSTYSKPVPTPGQWVNIEIGQEKVPTRRVSQGYVMKFSITVDGTRKRYVTNSKPSDFENVKVYASSSWYNAVSGAIKNLLIETKLDGRRKIDIFLHQFVFLIQLTVKYNTDFGATALSLAKMEQRQEMEV